MLRLLIFLFVLCGSATAQTVGLHLVSVHSRDGFNNTNPGLYVRTYSGWTTGVFRNSYSRVSVYGAYTWETDGQVSVALTAGAVTGYRARAIMPLVVPSVAYHFGDSAIRLAIIPKPPTKGGAAAAHLMVERHF